MVKFEQVKRRSLVCEQTYTAPVARQKADFLHFHEPNCERVIRIMLLYVEGRCTYEAHVEEAQGTAVTQIGKS